MSARRKFNLFFAFFPYGGNGGAPTEHPSIRNWFARAMRDLSVKYADQIASIKTADFADTPVTMTRNAAVCTAREAGADILIMVDSDMVPDMYLDPGYAKLFPNEAKGAKPFLETALQEFENRWHEGPYVVCAPYCGPPPESQVYVFRWASGSQEIADSTHDLVKFSREEAAIMTGVGPVAAQPTGLIAFDMRIFALCEPELNANEGRGWFYYEYVNGYHHKKGSTEDVTCTRDLSMMVQNKLGYNPLLCAWDSWAGHVKPVVVGKPIVTAIQTIEPRYRKAVLDGISEGERIEAACSPDSPISPEPLSDAAIQPAAQERRKTFSERVQENMQRENEAGILH